jgi:hypothetical protein
MGRLIRQGFRRGLRAAWLPGQDWQELFPQPLDEVRERLRIGSPLTYEAVRSEGAPVPVGDAERSRIPSIEHATAKPGVTE